MDGRRWTQRLYQAEVRLGRLVPERKLLDLVAEALSAVAHAVVELQRQQMQDYEVNDELKATFGTVVEHLIVLTRLLDLDLEEIAEGEVVKLETRRSPPLLSPAPTPAQIRSGV